MLKTGGTCNSKNLDGFANILPLVPKQTNPDPTQYIIILYGLGSQRDTTYGTAAPYVHKSFTTSFTSLKALCNTIDILHLLRIGMGLGIWQY